VRKPGGGPSSGTTCRKFVCNNNGSPPPVSSITDHRVGWSGRRVAVKSAPSRHQAGGKRDAGKWRRADWPAVVAGDVTRRRGRRSAPVSYGRSVAPWLVCPRGPVARARLAGPARRCTRDAGSCGSEWMDCGRHPAGPGRARTAPAANAQGSMDSPRPAAVIAHKGTPKWHRDHPCGGNPTPSTPAKHRDAFSVMSTGARSERVRTRYRQ
jgi:hypothetical protein